jgi:hypothetical protein
MAILEISGRFTCSDCGHVWSAMLGDDEIPSHCECEQDKGAREHAAWYDTSLELKQGKAMQYEIRERITLLVVTYVNADDLETAESMVMMQGAMEYDEILKIENQEIVASREMWVAK